MDDYTTPIAVTRPGSLIFSYDFAASARGLVYVYNALSLISPVRMRTALAIG